MCYNNFINSNFPCNRYVCDVLEIILLCISLSVSTFHSNNHMRFLRKTYVLKIIPFLLQFFVSHKWNASKMKIQFSKTLLFYCKSNANGVLLLNFTVESITIFSSLNVCICFYEINTQFCQNLLPASCNSTNVVVLKACGIDHTQQNRKFYIKTDIHSMVSNVESTSVSENDWRTN